MMSLPKLTTMPLALHNPSFFSLSPLLFHDDPLPTTS